MVFISSVRQRLARVKPTTVLFASSLLAFSVSAPVSASPIGAGWISTDRLGYSGTITPLEPEGPALDIGPRDLSLTGASNAASVGRDDAAIVMGSWWYSTEVDAEGNPRGAGWGNTTGNTGAGFMQYYNLPDSFDTNIDEVVLSSYAFSNFDGTYWTEFSYKLEVLDGEAFARLSSPSNTGDGGKFESLTVELTISGLEGQVDGDWIVANNHPTAVTGSISGIFQNTSATTENNGFYEFDFSLSMTNWAWENRDDLVGDEFRVSSFGAQASAVPAPGSLALLGLGLVGLTLIRRRKS
ncbi:PEP-CTERM sorting domain-containing protein [Ectothiorhodospira haloalkaliphila]|uniref:PEP-CTERM sorting domain-containing protein n=1 Tax=Ectothiorhodospira haloalkaliphila TaxID=421628 RepID=UPI001EE94311|nr:PEP-CTERM sorting domain-containing protein [Ectothiorhodospira haloalkaliphila]MCG5526220.1 PEP-CTERM sorting domain-containing protein [Ectothiorhodospira haloalkaliphila]